MPPSNRNVLIVGASGFIGGHLLTRLLDDGSRVETWSRSALRRELSTHDHCHARTVDVLGDASLPDAPIGGWDAVFQFAGESRPSRFVGQEHLRDTVRIASRVADHAAKTSPGCRYVLNSSAYVYSPSDTPCVEDSPTEPTGPYGLAKLLSEDVTQIHRNTMHVTIVRPFNLLGAGLPDGLYASDLLARLRTGTGPVQLPTPDSQRDMLDVRDAIQAYIALLDADYETGTAFNFCSGMSIAASRFAEALLAELGATREVRFDGSARPPLIGNPSRLKSTTGWAPEFGMEAIAKSLVRGH